MEANFYSSGIKTNYIIRLIKSNLDGFTGVVFALYLIRIIINIIIIIILRTCASYMACKTYKFPIRPPMLLKQLFKFTHLNTPPFMFVLHVRKPWSSWMRCKLTCSSTLEAKLRNPRQAGMGIYHSYAWAYYAFGVFTKGIHKWSGQTWSRILFN